MSRNSDNCDCLPCKLNAVLMSHFPGDDDKPIPDHELAQMRDALAKAAGNMLMGTSRNEMEQFVLSVTDAKKNAEIQVASAEIFGEGITIVSVN